MSRRRRTPYRHVRVDPYTGTRVIDATAFAILDLLTKTSGAVPVADIDDAIVRNGGSLNLKAAAVKGLRNIGVPVVVNKHRSDTTYVFGKAADIQRARFEDIKGWYSTLLSRERAVAQAAALQPHDQDLANELREVQNEAIRAGTHPAMGLTIQEVVTEFSTL